ncbi:MAG: enoyl-CoA hydratase-related protein [Thermoplasmatota archaeon]
MKIDLPVALDFYPLEGERSTRIQPFFENLRRGRLTTTKCRRCGELHWHPRVVCPSCSSDELEWVDLPKFGRLVNYTAMVVGAPMGFERDIPFVLGLVELEGTGIRIASRVDGVRYEDVSTGMALELKTITLDDGRVFFRFRPRSTADDIVASIKRVCVVGAGNMGSGIAQSFAQAGLDVSLVDVEGRLVDAGLARIRAPLEKRVAKGKMRADELEGLMGRIKGFTSLKEGVEGAGLVVEAVFEDLEVKKKLFAELDALCAPGAIFATNTSSLSVTELARSTHRPERFAGLHYFYPAAVNQLLEVVAAEGTAPEVVGALVELGRVTGKIPIAVKDSPGFAVNRFFVPWLNEACRLLESGAANTRTIDEAAKEAFGITMGPFELMNATGVPIAFHAESSLARALGGFYEPAEILRRQAQSGRPWELAGDVDRTRFDNIRERLCGVVFGVAVKLYEEGVSTIEDIDSGAVTGLRWRAGPFAMMNALGVGAAHELVRRVSEQTGGALAVPEALERQSRTGKPWRARAVKVVRDGPLATLLMNRPDQMNALSRAVLADLDETLGELEGDRETRVVILTGEGRAFIAGADIKEMSAGAPEDVREFTTLGQRVLRRLERLGKPVIAAINGFALGGGLEVALACDIRVASDRARLGLPEVRLGIFPGLGGTQRLTRLIGRGRACELIFTGDTIDAQRALSLGIVDRVVPHARLMAEARALARAIASNAPIAVGLAKSSINRALETGLDEGLRYELETVMRCMTTHDKAEGMRAFMEKRRPEFRGE